MLMANISSINNSRCRLCGNLSLKLFYRLETGKYIKCNKCGLVSVDPLPDANYIFNRATMWAKEFHAKPEKVNQVYSRHFQEIAYNEYLQMAGQFRSNGRLLDVGCGIGGFIDAASHCGWDSYGIDISNSVRIPQSKGLKAFQGYIEEMNFMDNYFDVITMFDVIEHIVDLNSLMSSVRRLLRPNGGLIIVTPNIKSLTSRLLRSKWQAVEPEDHYSLFSSSALEFLVNKYGFVTKKLLAYDINIYDFKYIFMPYLRSIEERKQRQKERRILIERVVNNPSLLYIRNNINRLLSLLMMGERLIIVAKKNVQ